MELIKTKCYRAHIKSYKKSANICKSIHNLYCLFVDNNNNNKKYEIVGLPLVRFNTAVFTLSIGTVSVPRKSNRFNLTNTINYRHLE